MSTKTNNKTKSSNRSRKNTNNLKFQFTNKKISIFVIIFVAIVGSLTLGGIFAQSQDKDYRLKTDVEQTVLSLTDEKPMVVSKGSDGRLNYESKGKSIDVTVTGKVYCSPEGNGEVKIAEISQEKLQSILSDIENIVSTVKTDNKITDEPVINAGKEVSISTNSKIKTINTKNDSATPTVNNSEQLLDEVCKSATTIVPKEKVPSFVPNSVNIKEIKKPKRKNPLRTSLIPSVSALETTNTAQPTLAVEAENDQVARINYERAIRGIPQMVRSDCLTRAARSWSLVMAKADRMAHSNLVGPIESECGTGWWERVGENVGFISERPLESYEIFQAYMNSPGHRANILNPEFQRVGVGANHYFSPGQRATLLWTTQLFARCKGACANK